MSDFERPTEGEVLWARVNLEIARENSERIRRGMSPLSPAERDNLRAAVLQGKPYASVSSLPVPAPAPEVPPVPELERPKVATSSGPKVKIPGRSFWGR